MVDSSVIFLSSYLLDFVLDGQFDTAEAGSVVGAWRALVHVAVQYGLYFLCVPTKVQHAHHKVLTLHGQLAVVILHESGVEANSWGGGEETGREGLDLKQNLNTKFESIMQTGFRQRNIIQMYKYKHHEKIQEILTVPSAAPFGSSPVWAWTWEMSTT